MTQAEQIIKYLENHPSISPMEAFNDLGITKLATRISEMIRDGKKIIKFDDQGTNRFGQRIRFKRYVLIRE